ncbi:hypothetical protein V1227_18815 [Lentzea sp. DG1S-22]|uniref:hypothetical protein n=1 Tax=Lentzea sp. DG1S-22 TaxID=3108822 RepID=UPI002E78ABB9|nr:hypothetical protein [Lentzea sp. DG1S-22]WVH84703.1 hypothetical protein V1227_18815 [Lentzea sp. DG1S-22]
MTSTLIPEFRYRIEHDEYAENPRKSGGTLTNVVTVLRRNYVPVDDDFGPLSDTWRRLAYRYSSPLAMRIFERYAQTIHGAVTLVDRPSDGAWAIWYVMPNKVWWWMAATRNNPELRQSEGLHLLKSERDEYRNWAYNLAVRYVIEKRTTWTNPDHGDRDTWEEVEAIGGYYDEADAEAEASRAVRCHEEEAQVRADSGLLSVPDEPAPEASPEPEGEDDVPDAVWEAVVAGPASLERVVAATRGKDPAWDVCSVINDVVRVAVRTVREFDAAQGQEPDPR